VAEGEGRPAGRYWRPTASINRLQELEGCEPLDVSDSDGESDGDAEASGHPIPSHLDDGAATPPLTPSPPRAAAHGRLGRRRSLGDLPAAPRFERPRRASVHEVRSDPSSQAGSLALGGTANTATQSIVLLSPFARRNSIPGSPDTPPPPSTPKPQAATTVPPARMMRRRASLTAGEVVASEKPPPEWPAPGRRASISTSPDAPSLLRGGGAPSPPFESPTPRPVTAGQNLTGFRRRWTPRSSPGRPSQPPAPKSSRAEAEINPLDKHSHSTPKEKKEEKKERIEERKEERKEESRAIGDFDAFLQGRRNSL